MFCRAPYGTVISVAPDFSTGNILSLARVPCNAACTDALTGYGQTTLLLGCTPVVDARQLVYL
jgi:hypothetical protein